jgi:hypothetical protein
MNSKTKEGQRRNLVYNHQIILEDKMMEKQTMEIPILTSKVWRG